MEISDPQWRVVCNICEKHVRFYCNTCGDCLCEQCRSYHQRSNASRNHTIVEYSEKVPCERKTCSTHEGQEYILFCEPCGIPVCVVCITDIHGGHSFKSIDDTYDKQKPETADRLQYIRSWKIPDAEDLLANCQASTATYLNAIDDVDKVMTSSAEKIHSQVNHTLSSARKMLQEEKLHYLKMLQGHEGEARTHLSELKALAETHDTSLRTNNKILLLLLARNLRDANLEAPTKPREVPLPAFVPGTIDAESLQQQFGQFIGTLSNKERRDVRKKEKEEKEVRLKEDKEARKKEKEDKAVIIPIQVQCGDCPCSLIRSQTHVKELQVSVTSAFIACAGTNITWVTSDKELIRVMENPTCGSSGEVLDEEVKINVKAISDMHSGGKGGLFIGDKKSRCVRKVSEHLRTDILFSTGMSAPFGIASLPNNNILVAFRDEGKVVKYSHVGRAVQEFVMNLRFPTYVAYNGVTEDICVSDAEDPYTKGQVVVFKANGKLRFRYQRENPDYFVPQGIRADHCGHILVADSGMNCIHILEKYGKFLMYIKSGNNPTLTMPCHIEVDVNGCIWISENETKTIHVFRYLENAKVEH